MASLSVSSALAVTGKTNDSSAAMAPVQRDARFMFVLPVMLVAGSWLTPSRRRRAGQTADQRIGTDRKREQHDQHGVHAGHVEHRVGLHNQVADAGIRQL